MSRGVDRLARLVRNAAAPHVPFPTSGCPQCNDVAPAPLCRYRAPLRQCVAPVKEGGQCPQAAMCGLNLCEDHWYWAQVISAADEAEVAVPA